MRKYLIRSEFSSSVNKLIDTDSPNPKPPRPISPRPLNKPAFLPPDGDEGRLKGNRGRFQEEQPALSGDYLPFSEPLPAKSGGKLPPSGACRPLRKKCPSLRVMSTSLKRSGSPIFRYYTEKWRRRIDDAPIKSSCIRFSSLCFSRQLALLTGSLRFLTTRESHE